MSEPDVQVEITDAESNHRFELRIDGTLVSLADYVDDGERRIFPHTQTLAEFGGRGYGTQVVRAALDATIAADRRIVATCPFVRAIVEQDPGYAQHAAETDAPLG